MLAFVYMSIPDGSRENFWEHLDTKWDVQLYYTTPWTQPLGLGGMANPLETFHCLSGPEMKHLADP